MFSLRIVFLAFLALVLLSTSSFAAPMSNVQRVRRQLVVPGIANAGFSSQPVAGLPGVPRAVPGRR